MAISVSVASAHGVAERWRKQYQSERGAWTQTMSGDSQETYNKLLALGASASPDAVAGVIGNESWTHPMCRACSEYVSVAADLGGSDESVVICAPCLEAGAAAVRAVVKFQREGK